MFLRLDDFFCLFYRYYTVKPKALLVFPPVYDFAFYDMFVKPYGLLRIGKWLSESGFDVELLNCLDYTDAQSFGMFGILQRRPDGTGKVFRQIVKKPNVLQGVKRYFSRYGILSAVIEKRFAVSKPDVILVGSGMTYWYLGVQEVIDAAKQICPNTPVILGGVYAVLCKEHAENCSGADFVVSGDGGAFLPEILRKLQLPVPEIPYPRTQLLVKEGFLDSAAIRLHSGCPHRCTYCASEALCGKFQAGDGEELAKEVLDIHQTFDVKNFAFYDDALLFKAETGIIPFFEKIIESGLTLSFYFPNGLHIAFLTEQIAVLMKKAGCRDLRFGFESNDKGFQSEYGKKYSEDMFSQVIDIVRSAGFPNDDLAAYIMAGLPGQHPGEVEETINILANSKVRVFVNEYSPIPKTGLWDKSVAQSRFPIADEPLCHNNSLFALQSDFFSLEDLFRLKRMALELTRRK